MWDLTRAVSVNLSFFIFLYEQVFQATAAPNVIIFLADDLGWNDVSFHGSNQFMTPNIDALAYSGVILNDYYTQPICTPARAALLTGRHPIHNGMHHTVIYAPEPWGLPLSEQLMPQYLRKQGYKTHGVGKWHLGHFKTAYTPTMRGFDSFYGPWVGHQDHFTHFAFEKHPGYDWHRDLNISWGEMGRYDTDLFSEEAENIIKNHNNTSPLFLYMAYTAPHAPLQAPRHVVEQFDYISNHRRQIFAGDKATLWEGGVRAVGLVWSPLLSSAPRVHHGLVNVQDWLPTIFSCIHANYPDFKRLDGVSQWDAISQGTAAPYTKMIHNIDPTRKKAALRYNQWKLIIDNSRRTQKIAEHQWFGKLEQLQVYDINKVIDSLAGQALSNSSRPLPSIETILKLRSEATIKCSYQKDPSLHRKSLCQPHKAPCLFNIDDDPCEQSNVARKHPELSQLMMSLIQEYELVKPRKKPPDPRSFPHHWNNTWISWKDQNVSI